MNAREAAAANAERVRDLARLERGRRVVSPILAALIFLLLTLAGWLGNLGGIP